MKRKLHDKFNVFIIISFQNGRKHRSEVMYPLIVFRYTFMLFMKIKLSSLKYTCSKCSRVQHKIISEGDIWKFSSGELFGNLFLIY